MDAGVRPADAAADDPDRWLYAKPGSTPAADAAIPRVAP
jgi:hypothetical protein